MEGDVWFELIGLGLNAKLRLDKSVMVWCGAPRRYYPLKCFIANANTEDTVRCLDGSELNLVRSNLAVDAPPAKLVENYRDMLDPHYGRTAITIEYKFGKEWGINADFNNNMFKKEKPINEED
jgi:hypothetical protein